MKLKLFIYILWTMVSTAVNAQSANLKVNQIFTGKVIPLERMVVTKVKGRALSKYGLNYYRSARFVASRKERYRCINAVEQDMRAMGSGSTAQKRSERHTAIAFMLRPQGANNRFITLVCNKEDDDQYGITLIYMEGTVKSLNELNKLINK